MSLSTADPTAITMTYDNALRPTAYVADSAANNDPIHDAAYTYNKDGLVSGIDNNADEKFTQANEYDFAGRLKKNDVGTNGTSYPFRQSLTYDAFNSLTGRSTFTYNLSEVAFTAGYTNNRKSSGGGYTGFDNSGNVTVNSGGGNTTYWYFDAAGRTTRWEEHAAYGNSQKKGEETVYDGDGRPVKVIDLEDNFISGSWTGWVETPKYYIYSTVTGQKITDIFNDGTHFGTHVNMGDTVIADQFENDVNFRVTDPEFLNHSFDHILTGLVIS